MTSRTPRRLGLALVIVGAMLTILALPALAAPPAGLHCPDGFISKDTSGADDNDLVLEEGTVFCVKAGSPESNESEQGNTGILIADGETTLCEYLIAAGIVGGGGDCRDVSYWAEYAPQDTPTPTPSPTPELTPTPPTPTPEPTPPPTGTGTVSTPTPVPFVPNTPNTAMSVPSALPILVAGLSVMLLGGLTLTWARTRRR